MDNAIVQIVMRVLGGAGAVGIIFQLADIYLKRIDKPGVWEDIGKMFRDFGSEGGQELADLIPGDEAEPRIIELVKMAKDIPDKLLLGFIEGLNEGIDDPEKKVDIDPDKWVD